MKHFTDIIPLSLAEKLKEKGMPMITSVSISIIEDKPVVDENGEQWYRPSYAEVFDWLMEKGIILYLDATYKHFFWRIDTVEGILQTEEFITWHEAANAAIEKALTLI